MNFDVLSPKDYLILRATAKKLQEKYECDLRHCPESMRTMSLKNIINLDLVISRCMNSESSFTADECKLLIAAVINYRGKLSQSSESAHFIIPLLLEKLKALFIAVDSEKELPVYTIRDSILMNG